MPFHSFAASINASNSPPRPPEPKVLLGSRLRGNDEMSLGPTRFHPVALAQAGAQEVFWTG